MGSPNYATTQSDLTGIHNKTGEPRERESALPNHMCSGWVAKMEYVSKFYTQISLIACEKPPSPPIPTHSQHDMLKIQGNKV